MRAVNSTQVVVHLGAVNQATVNNSSMQKRHSSKAVARKGASMVEVISCVQTTICLSNAKLCVCSICLSWWWKLDTSKS